MSCFFDRHEVAFKQALMGGPRADNCVFVCLTPDDESTSVDMGADTSYIDPCVGKREELGLLLSGGVRLESSPL